MVFADWLRTAKIMLHKISSQRHIGLRCRQVLWQLQLVGDGMALYCYIKQQSDDELPDSWCPCQGKTSALSRCNEGVRRMIQKPAKRSSYAKFTSEQKAAMRKRAAEHGVAATNRSLLQKKKRTCDYIEVGVHAIHENCFHTALKIVILQKLCPSKTWCHTVSAHFLLAIKPMDCTAVFQSCPLRVHGPGLWSCPCTSKDSSLEHPWPYTVSAVIQ